MSERLAKVVTPRIHVGIEVNEGHRAILFVQSTQQGKRHRVISTEGNEMVEFARLLFDALKAFLDFLRIE